MQKAANLFNVPIALTAKTPEALQELMLKTNFEGAHEYLYFDFQFVKGNWYCWYFKNLKQGILPHGIQTD